MRSLRYLALLMVAAFVFSGCSIIKVNPERDGQQVVAEVNGEPITKKQVYDAAQITWDQRVESWDLAAYKKKKEDALNNLVEELVIKQKAKELGYYTFTADEQKTIDDAVAAYKTSDYNTILAGYQEKAKTNPAIKPEELANADIEIYRQKQEYNIAYGKAQKAVTDPITPTDAEVKSSYDSLLATEKTQFDKDNTVMPTFESYYGYPILYYPTDGFIRIRRVLLLLPDDIQKQIGDLRTAGKNADADKLRDDELKKIEAKANEALTAAKAAAGDKAKLDKVIADFGKDPGMTSDNPGYLINIANAEGADSVTLAATKLTTINTPSDLVATDIGYNIIWLSEKLAKGDVPLDQIKDKMTAYAKASKQSTEWQNTITGWMTEYKPKITTHLDRLHN